MFSLFNNNLIVHIKSAIFKFTHGFFHSLHAVYLSMWYTIFPYSCILFFVSYYYFRRSHCVIIVEETMNFEALFGAKTIVCILVFVQFSRPLTCWKFVLGLNNIALHTDKFSSLFTCIISFSLSNGIVSIKGFVRLYSCILL